MDHADKVWAGITLVGILLLVIGEIVYFRRGKVTAGRFGRGWPILGNAVLIPVLHIAQHHGQFLLASMLFFGWVAVCVFAMCRANREEVNKEIAEGRIPKIYNDWAKPDPL